MMVLGKTRCKCAGHSPRNLTDTLTNADDELLDSVARDGEMDYIEWPNLLEQIVPRLDHIIYNAFPLPSIPLPHPPSLSLEDPATIAEPDKIPDVSSFAQTPSSHNNAQSVHNAISPSITTPAGSLPPELLSLQSSIISTLTSHFSTVPPYTVQRLAELICRPTDHYRTLPSYLRALDRVVTVSSPASTFPLPSIGALSAGNGNLVNGNSTQSDDYDDEVNGAANLTLIPWLSNSNTDLSIEARDHPTTGDMHTDATSMSDGPNGTRSFETAVVSSNGDNTSIVGGEQGEIPGRGSETALEPVMHGLGGRVTRSTTAMLKREEDGEGDSPHARGPDEIGVEDMGPQTKSRGMQTFDVAAALGRTSQTDDVVKDKENQLPTSSKSSSDEHTMPVDADGMIEGQEDKAAEKGSGQINAISG